MGLFALAGLLGRGHGIVAHMGRATAPGEVNLLLPLGRRSVLCGLPGTMGAGHALDKILMRAIF